MTAADLAILGPAGNNVRVSHLLISTYLSMLLGLAVWRWFPGLEMRTTEASTVRFLKWGTAAMAFIVVAWAVMPRRILWETFPVVAFENRTLLVIGTTREWSLLYAPDEPGRPSVRVRSDAPGIRRTGENRTLFGQESKP